MPSAPPSVPEAAPSWGGGSEEFQDLDEPIKGQIKVGKIILVLALVFVVALVAVGSFMYRRFLQRFNELNVCKKDVLVKDKLTE